ncbi:MAG: hypothetical protein KF685_02835 [Acidobacteria bacterium]|nr:hypothetical protein [Acidobacteriota bacterium]
MSTRFSPITCILACFGLILQNFTFAAGQDITAQVKIDGKTGKLVVIGQLSPNAAKGFRRNLGFIRSRQNILQISEMMAIGADGDLVKLTKLSPTEWVADADIVSWRYTIDAQAGNGSDIRAGNSWIKGDDGVLMFEDILPAFGINGVPVSAEIEIEMPERWRLFSSENDGGNIIRTADLASSIAGVGSGWELVNVNTSAGSLRLIRMGLWGPSTEQMSNASAEIFNNYVDVFGSPASENSLIILARRSSPAFDEWEAEVRGATVVIASSDATLPGLSVQQLHEQLRHEIFHLWVPNGVNLTGEYSWFYEGFALYQSLRTALQLNRISFNDFLDTISKAYSVDVGVGQRRSLVELAKDRRERHGTELYARGLLVAFMTDAAMLQRSKDRSVENLLSEVFKKHHRSPTVADGNNAVLGIMKGHREIAPIVRRFIEGSEKADLSDTTKAVGLSFQDVAGSKRLRVVEKPSGRQRAILDKLGYNNWRKSRKYQNEN